MKINIKDIIYVSLQVLLLIAYLFNINILHFKPLKFVSVLGLILFVLGIIISIIAILQLRKSLSPFPSPRSNTQLITEGLYKYIRHPIYSGIILITFGFSLYEASFYKIMISILLYTLLHFKSLYEEKKLTIKFHDYKDYRNFTGRFFPKFK